MKIGILRLLRSIGHITKSESTGATVYSINNQRFSIQIFVFHRTKK